MNRIQLLSRVLAATLVVGATVVSATAQVTTGTITGTVKDEHATTTATC
jgi:hypothetical protein